MKLLVQISLVLLPLFFSVSVVDSLNILGIFPYQGKSHFFVFEPYLQELARRGHNLTVISHFPQKQPLKNYQDISLAGKVKVIEDAFPVERSYITIIQIAFFLVEHGTGNCRLLLENEGVQNLWKSNSKFDLVVTEQFNSDCSLGLAHALGAPVVGLTSHALMPWHYNRFGIQYNPSYVPFIVLEGGTHPTLYQRIERTIFEAFFNTLYKYFDQAVDRQTLSKYFKDVPDLEELARDIKMMLVYHNFVLTGSRLFPANVKEVGGYHVAKPKQLPDDVKKFIEESEHGVIYISFGSMVQAKTMPKEKLNAIIGAISELPQRVIWKWQDETLLGATNNVFLSDWLPQNDILAHPKVLAFYSHTGLLSTTEAIHHGVPIVAMPILGDQPSNAAAVEESGLGVQVQIRDLTKEKLLTAFKKVLNPEFRSNVRRLSKAWHDQPLSAMDSAVYWTEFAARHKNFTFRSAAADVPLYQYLCLDILSTFVAIPLAIVFVVKLLFCSGSATKASKSGKNKSKEE